jgi:Right handed beta helix region
MKSLDQIRSAGIAINATNTLGDSNYAYIISAPGSYYLGGNLHVSGTNGIHVTSSGVTVDLNGFQIDRTAGSDGVAIAIDSTANSCTVKNGSIVGFDFGIGGTGNAGAFVGLAVSGCTNTGLLAGDGSRIEGCRAQDVIGTGIRAGSGVNLANCSALNNVGLGIQVADNCTLINCASTGSGAVGISVGIGCTLTNCTANGGADDGIKCSAISANCAIMNCNASANSGNGISANTGSTLTNCTAVNNNGSLSSSAGITVLNDCALTNCSASGNRTTNPNHLPSAGAGFSLGSGCTMQNCVAADNVGDGVSYVGSCFITGNSATHNGFSGFRALGPLNRIDSNVANSNAQIGIIWINDFVVRNTAFLNSAFNYSPPVGTGNTGPLQTAGTATNPWANF